MRYVRFWPRRYRFLQHLKGTSFDVAETKASRGGAAADAPQASCSSSFLQTAPSVSSYLFIELYQSLLVCVSSAASVRQQNVLRRNYTPFTRARVISVAWRPLIKAGGRIRKPNKSRACCRLAYKTNTHVTNTRTHSNKAIKHKRTDEASAPSSRKECRRSGKLSSRLNAGIQSIARRHPAWCRIWDELLMRCKKFWGRFPDLNGRKVECLPCVSLIHRWCELGFPTDPIWPIGSDISDFMRFVCP